MVEGKQIVERPVFLRPSYDKEVPYTQQYENAYKTWFAGMLFNINWYVELLHKQLVRKGRCSKRDFNEHPLFKDAYIVNGYDIKTPSTQPYDRDSQGDLGLNQFFVGQDPKKHYQGDPGGDDGIYHDESKIVLKGWVGLSHHKYGRPVPFTTGVPLVADVAFYDKYQQELKDAYYITGFDIEVYHILSKPRFENGRFKAWSKEEIKLPSAKWLKIIDEIKARKFYFSLPEDAKNWSDTRKENYKRNAELRFENKKRADIAQACRDGLKEANPDKTLHMVPKDYTLTTIQGVKPEYRTANFLEIFYRYRARYNKFGFRAMIFNKNLIDVIYEQPLIAIGEVAYPLYRKSTDAPFGRLDKWFILWNEFYELYVKEHKEKWEKYFTPVVVIVLIVITIFTYGTTSELVAAGLNVALGISEAIAMNIAGALIISSTALSVGSLLAASAGNKGLADALGLAGAVVGLVTAVAGGIGAINEAMKEGASQAVTSGVVFESAMLAGETLMGGYNIYNSIKSLTQDTPSLLEEEESDDEGFFGKDDEQEQKKDEFNEYMDMFNHWYDLETEDFTGENLNSALVQNASSVRVFEPVNYALNKKLAFRL